MDAPAMVRVQGVTCREDSARPLVVPSHRRLAVLPHPDDGRLAGPLRGRRALTAPHPIFARQSWRSTPFLRAPGACAVRGKHPETPTTAAPAPDATLAVPEISPR